MVYILSMDKLDKGKKKLTEGICIYLLRSIDNYCIREKILTIKKLIYGLKISR